MPETAPEPNEKPANCGVVSVPSARRRVLRFLALLFLLVAGLFGWEQYQLSLRQAAAPVVSVADDGTVRINGHVITITPEGLPGPGLALVEGEPPVEVLPMMKGDTIWYRLWLCPRTGVRLGVSRRVSTRDGTLYYEGQVYLGPETKPHEFPAWLEMRRQRWWLGRPGPLGQPTQRQVARHMDPRGEMWEGDGSWELFTGETNQWLYFNTHGPLVWMNSRLLSRMHLHSALVHLPETQGSNAAVKEESW